MPFEISPKIVAPQIASPFDADADAMLAGCAVLDFHKQGLFDSQTAPRAACALGAWVFGKYNITNFDNEANANVRADMHGLQSSYSAVYCAEIAGDNDSGAYTREQIAERIRALR